MSIYKNLIGGEWIEGADVNRNMNPSDLSDVVGEYARADAKQAGRAIAAARAAFPAWSRGSIQARADMLEAIGNEILARKEELGNLLAREEGKTLPEGIGEAARAGQIFKFFAGEVLRPEGEKLPSIRPGVDVEITREPVGVVGMITPWNFPIAIPAWKIAPALAHGNCVVFKPADLVPGCAWALADIIARAGIPDGVFNLVMGRGSLVGEVILNSPDIDAITFTGSVETGRTVATRASNGWRACRWRWAARTLWSCWMTRTSTRPSVARSRAPIISTGQRCTASSRLIVTKGIHDRFVSAVEETLKALKVDDARKEGTQIGPVVDQSQLDQDLSYIDIGVKEGAKLACGGERLNRGAEGFYLAPALLTETSNDMRVNREEIFGPVATVIRVKDYDEALAVSNDTIFGLSAGICTTSLKHASDFKRNSEAGMTMVNLPTAGVDYHVPFGGRKGSSYGPREQGRYAREFYTIVKTSYTLPE